MSTAARMRKYRARKALRDALERAERNGVDVVAVLEEWHAKRVTRELREREPVTPIGVTVERRRELDDLAMGGGGR